MRVGSFSLRVLDGREHGSGHVELRHGDVYSLQLRNHDYRRRADAVVTIDGKELGAYRVPAGSSIRLERSSHDEGRFTFHVENSPEAKAGGVADVTPDQRGLIEVRFMPEVLRENVVRPATISKSSILRSRSSDPGDREMSFSGPDPDDVESVEGSAAQAGITTLTGRSDQQFTSVPPLEYDSLNTVTIRLRLVSGSEVRRLTEAPKSNPVPRPV